MKKNLTNSTPSKLNLRIIACLVLFLGLSLSSCLRDKDEYGYSINPNDFDGTEAKFIMNVNTPVFTRAYDWVQDGGEYRLNTLDVLAFDSITGEYRYRTYGTDLDVINGNQTEARVKLKITENNERHQYVLLGNLRKEIHKLAEEGIFDQNPPLLKDELLKKITFSVYDANLTEQNRIWNITTPNYLPMWGETFYTYEIDSVGSIYEPIKENIQLLRGMARVDFFLKPEAGKEGYFLLEDIIFANVPASTHAVPDTNHVNKRQNVNEKIVVQYPTLVQNTEHKYVKYGSELSWQKDSLLNTIYIPEFTKDVAHTERLCILISGRYNPAGDGNFSSIDTTWYRVDFYDTQGYWLNILRNHRYSFYITAIDGPGESSREEALKSKSVNMKTETLVWDDMDVEEVYYDGYYYYYASPRKVEFNQYGCDSLAITEIVTNSRYTNIELEIVNTGNGNIFKIDPYIGDSTSAPSGNDIITKANLYISLDVFTGIDPDIHAERKADIYIHFKDDDGFKKVTIPITVIQNNGTPKYRVFNRSIIYIDPFVEGRIEERSVYLLLEGEFESVPVRVSLETYSDAGDHSGQISHSTIFNGANEHISDGYIGYDSYSSVKLTKLPIYGINGFPYKKDDSTLPPYEPLNYNYKFDYYLNDSWSIIGRSTTFNGFYVTIDASDNNFAPLPLSGGIWDIKITGKWQDDLIFTVVDGNTGQPITTNFYHYVSNPNELTTVNLSLTIPAHTQSRSLQLHFSITGDENDLDACNQWYDVDAWKYQDIMQQ